MRSEVATKKVAGLQLALSLNDVRLNAYIFNPFFLLIIVVIVVVVVE